MLIHSHCPREDIEAYLKGTEAVLYRLLAEERINDALPIIRTVSDQPVAEDVARMALECARKCIYDYYRDAVEVLCPPCLPLLAEPWLVSMVQDSASRDSSNETRDVLHRIDQLFPALKQAQTSYSLALRTATIEAALHRCKEILSHLFCTAQWQDDGESRGSIIHAAAAACAGGGNEILRQVLSTTGPTPAETRLAREMHDDTWRTATEAIPVDSLLAAQPAAAEADNESNFEWISHAPTTRELTPAQRGLHEINIARREEYEARLERSGKGFDRMDSEKVCVAVVDSDQDWLRVCDERCAVCCESRVVPDQCDRMPLAGPEVLYFEAESDLMAQSIGADSNADDLASSIGTPAADALDNVAIGQSPPEDASECLVSTAEDGNAQSIVRVPCPGRHLVHKERVVGRLSSACRARSVNTIWSVCSQNSA